MPGFSSGCSSEWSCRVGRYVIINQERWKHASPAWNAAQRRAARLPAHGGQPRDRPLARARPRGLPGPGRPAPVMMQQSKGLARLPLQPVADGPRAGQPDSRARTGHGVRRRALVTLASSPSSRRASWHSRGAPLREIVVFSGSAHRPLATGHLRGARRRAQLGRADPVQQRLPPGPAPGQLPPARRLHRPAAGAADAGAPDGAAADDRRGPRRLGARRSPR